MEYYYVYQLIDPRTKNPFYVGKGKINRWADHSIEARRSPDKWSNRKKCQYIRNLWEVGLEPQVAIDSEHAMEQSALERELELITQYGRLHDGSGILTNQHIHNSPSSKPTVPVTAYTQTGAIVGSYPSLTQAAKAHGIHKSTICAALNKRIHSAAGFRWFHSSEEFTFAPSPSGVSVDQYDYNGNHIATYSSIKDAAQAVGVSYTAITDAHAGRTSSAGGYQWALRGELPRVCVTERMRAVSSQRELVAYDVETGVEVGVYQTIKEAVTATAANPSGISDCAAGRKKSSGGLRWGWRLILLN